METFTIHAENVNVEDIMKEIQRRCLKKSRQESIAMKRFRRITELKQDYRRKRTSVLAS
jgi:hypothetical protein